MARRIEFVEHDFFTPQPVKDADVYLLRMILHDWPDEKAVAILKHIAEAMKEGSRIFIMDMVLPAPGSGSPTLEAALRQKDLTMRQVLHARERELEDWRTLVTEADARLRIVAVRQPEGSQYVSRVQSEFVSADLFPPQLDIQLSRLRNEVLCTGNGGDSFVCFTLEEHVVNVANVKVHMTSRHMTKLMPSIDERQEAKQLPGRQHNIAFCSLFFRSSYSTTLPLATWSSTHPTVMLRPSARCPFLAFGREAPTGIASSPRSFYDLGQPFQCNKDHS